MKKRLAMLVLLTFAVSVTAPLAVAADDGATLYKTKCAMCHGADGVAKSMAKGSGNFNDPKWQEATSAETIEKDITNGKNKMTPFKDKLTPEQIKAIAAYVKTIK